METEPQVAVLVFSVADINCALPAAHVIETMRMLPVVAVDDMPPFALGVALIRGASVPVIDLGTLLGRTSAAPARLVTVRTGSGVAALAVDAVRGLERFDRSELARRPEGLSEGPAPLVRALAAKDRALHLVLDATRLLAPRDGSPA